MPKLIIKRKANLIQEFNISEEKKYTTIGSGEENDLVLSDSKIAEDHLFIEKRKDGYFVTVFRHLSEGLGSSSETTINEKMLTSKTKLNNGDRIRIGNHTLIFRMYLAEDDIAMDEKTKVVRKAQETKSYNTEQQKRDKSVAEEGVTPLKNPKTTVMMRSTPYYLLSIYGPYFGKKFKLRFGRNRIGRDKALNDIIISLDTKGELDTSISRRHATIFFKQGQFFISDKRSSTRTNVNRIKLTESDEIPLNPKDEIEIISDKTSTIFRLVEEGDWHFSHPKRTGSWWVRWKYPFLKTLSVLIMIGAILILVRTWKERTVVKQNPEQLIITAEAWLAERSEDKIDGNTLAADQQLVSTPLFSDFSHNGRPGIVLVDHRGRINGYDGRTREKSWPPFELALVQPPLSPVLEDVNGDGVKDIIIATMDSKIYVIDALTGKEIWSSELLGGKLSTTPVVADFDGNGQTDILVCSEDGKLYLGKGSETEVSWKSFDHGHTINSTPSAADIDGDGVLEVLIGDDYGEVLVFDPRTEIIEQTLLLHDYFDATSASKKSRIRSSLGLGDINGDFIIDIVIATQQGNNIAIDGQSMQLIWYQEFKDADETKFYHPAPVLADLNSDGILDVVLCSTGGTVRALKGVEVDDNFVLWEHTEQNESFISSPGLADLNRDGTMDVIVLGISGALYVIDGRTGLSLWNGTGVKISGVGTSPVIGDVDGDGKVDILCAGPTLGKTMRFQTNTRTFEGTILWEQLSNGSTHTGIAKLQTKLREYELKLLGAIVIFSAILAINLFYEIKRKKLIEL